MFLPGEELILTVNKADHGKRLDLVVNEHLRSTSRSRVQRYIKEGYILLNSRRSKGSARVKAGDSISGNIPRPHVPDVLAEDLPITFLYQDGYIAVVDKPAGMVVHPAGRITSGTLVNALLYHCRDLQGVGGVMRPGIVHRLDKGTSGVMVVAKNDRAHEILATQFKERAVEKTYLALVYGTMAQDRGVIVAPVGRHPTDRKRFSVRTRTPKEALTDWEVKERFHEVTFVQIKPKTGRTHQIRVHMSAMNHPLVGDPVYARKKRLVPMAPHLRNCIEKLGRQALHAHTLSFYHPATGEHRHFIAALPEDMRGLLETLRRERR